MDKFEELNKEEKCPECGIHAPKRQIENLGICERCSLEGYKLDKTGQRLNPENNIVDRWKTTTPSTEAQIKSTV